MGLIFFPKQVYLWGSILEKKRLDTLVGADLALLGALGWVGLCSYPFFLNEPKINESEMVEVHPLVRDSDVSMRFNIAARNSLKGCR